MRTYTSLLKLFCVTTCVFAQFLIVSNATANDVDWTKKLDNTQKHIDLYTKSRQKNELWSVQITFNRDSLGGAAKFCAVEHYYCSTEKSNIDSFVKNFVDRVFLMNIAGRKKATKHPEIWAPIQKVQKIEFVNGTEKKVELQGGNLFVTVDWTSAPYKATNGNIPDEDFYVAEVKKAIQAK